ncbi:MAG TPA: C40 family peptidase [Gemmatimonadaceae bacterium]|nr:C40 family peptidase [Gemmatimonadaceae bacterium]
MRIVRTSLIASLVATLLLPIHAPAQTTGAVEWYGTLMTATPITRTMGGMAMSIGTPFLGGRVSGALGTSSTTYRASNGPGSSRLAWATDADLLVGPVNSRATTGVLPYAFAGLGMQNSTETGASGVPIRTWSYGGGARMPLGSVLSLSAEARLRRLASSATFSDSQFVRNPEIRVGLSLRFGGGTRSRTGTSTVYSRGRTDNPPSARRPRTTNPSKGRPVSTTSARGASRRVVPDAETYIGVPYKWGGSSPETGFDCSGLVQYVYSRQGVSLPRTSRQMAGAGVSVDARVASMREGDLMLFAQNGEISHVAIYAGGGRIIHSSSSGGGVRYDDLGTRRGQWFVNHMVAARRVSDDPRVIVNALAAAVISFDHYDPPDEAPAPGKR